MIIHEENSETQSESPAKSSGSALPTALPVQRRQSSPGAAPPSYFAATAATSSTPGPHSPLLPYQPGSNPRADRVHPQMMSQGYQDHTAYAALEQRRGEIHRRTRKRFFQALCIGILCYILLMAFIGSTVQFDMSTPWIGDGDDDFPPVPPHHPNPPSTPDAPDITSHPNPTGRDAPPGTPPLERKPWPVSDDGEITHCSGEDSWSHEPPSSTPFLQTYLNDKILSGGDKRGNLPYTAYNVFTLPVDATEKSIFSRGRHASGSILLRTRDADDEDDLIKIVIQASYRYREALECNLCTLKKATGAHSLGIYTSRDFDGAKDIRFTVDVYFPKSRSAASVPRDMGIFTSYLSWFDYSISTLDEVFFTHLGLLTESDKMHSAGVLAHVVHLSGSNGAITGTFNITEEAAIATSNAKIDVDLNVFHIEKDGPSKAARVTLATNNAPILARNNLYHVVESGDDALSTGGNFSVIVSTKNAAVNVSFATAPVDSLLDVTVGTSNGDANVHLHPTFEGDVTLMTTNGRAEVYQSDGVEDPTGRERDRIVVWKQSWWFWAIGWVGWGEKKHVGRVVVTTSNAGNHLYL